MSDLRDRIEVPRLSDLSRQRIRQDVFARLDAAPATEVSAPAPRRRTRQVVIATAAAAACLLIGGAAVRLWPRSDAAVEPVSRVATGPAPSRVSVSGAELIVAADSALTVSEHRDGGVSVVLEHGEVECAVAPRKGLPPFVVVAADVRVEVVGTRFTVSRRGDRVGVEVQIGTVRVLRADSVSRVEAGERWPAPVERAAVEPPAAPAEPAEPPDLEMDPMIIDSHPPGRAAGPRGRRSPEAGATAPDGDRERYETAARLEARRPGEALAIYRDIVASGGPWASNALFAQARLELVQGHRPVARQLLERYLRRYPSGANASLAQTLLADLR